MENNEKKQPVAPLYKRYTDYNVDLYTLDSSIERRILSGKALISPEKNEFIFSQNPPRGQRSVEIGRTLHCRFRRCPNGGYVATFRFEGSEKNIREQLIAEIRDVYRGVEFDLKKVKITEKQIKKENNEKR